MLRKRRKDNNILQEISSYLDFIWYLIILSVACVFMVISFLFFQVSFIQNLVFCVERVYRVPDFGVWERGSKYNNGSTELHSRYFPSFKGILVLFKCIDLNTKLKLQSIKLDLLLILVQLVFLSVILIGFTYNKSNVLGIIDRCLKGEGLSPTLTHSSALSLTHSLAFLVNHVVSFPLQLHYLRYQICYVQAPAVYAVHVRPFSMLEIIVTRSRDSHTFNKA